MLQEIIALSIVSGAVLYLLYGLFCLIFVRRKNDTICAGCEKSGCISNITNKS
jgi:hypothetical protein